ncbi:DISARM system helicase DrmA [Actinocrinis puniceicyclus]|uniref:DISARM system helicase DrmA n=1 Tax=Actinocrinis puniceicyclus TaxID=977794 RepID=A0A8J7WQR4_9ACTN|nr:DISARM system helicase DrmA [Actinocrinis puniceicyclus]MBS2964247.1 DISARM system helicase DrmA [Actinocrinis puniceicyclus]
MSEQLSVEDSSAENPGSGPDTGPGPGSILRAPTPQEVRDELAAMVVRDLRGPVHGDEEQLGNDPREWYVLGKLAPNGTEVAPDQLDTLAESDSCDTDDNGTDPETQAPNTPSLVPSSLGFTARVKGTVTELLVSATWGEYTSVADPERPQARRYQRQPRGGEIPVKLAEGTITAQTLDPQVPDVKVRGRVRWHDDAWLVTLFLVNTQSGIGVRPWVFQAELAARSANDTACFLPRRPADRTSKGGDATDRAEQRRLAMAYRLLPEFAIGHSCGAHAHVDPGDPMRARRIVTATAPQHELPATDVPDAAADPDLPELASLVLDMKVLAALEAEPLRAALLPLVTGYRAWIERAQRHAGQPEARLDGFRPEIRDTLTAAREAATRIEAGIDLLTGPPGLRDERALAAFRFANSAMHQQRIHTIAAAQRRRDPNLLPDQAVAAADADERAARNRSWRPFQLAFLLLNLPALADPGHPERSTDTEAAIADLLWFPTGGGKTEAYLGLTAFTLAIRRLQPESEYGGYRADRGIAVLMRYTLRLLTIQQFYRAAALICACEVLRRADTARWGSEPFRIGLWVGGDVTPNSVDRAEEWVRELNRDKGRPRLGGGSPHQLTHCPWCGSALEAARAVTVDLKGLRRTWVRCPDVMYCPFGPMGEYSGAHGAEPGLPVVVTDEELYRLLPSLVIATVDKFAQLPWQGATRTLFGGVDRYCERHGHLAAETTSAAWESATGHQATDALPPARILPGARIRPPDLIVQDELHLISGPLGSLVGLYESAVDRLATWERGPGKYVRPKVIASTATVRRARKQIGALFNRETRIFPPPGLDADDSFFARTRPVQGPGSRPGRLYVGLCAHGSRIKNTHIRVYVALLAAAHALHEKYGRNEITDPYMTVVGYFNSLRDLGGMRRLVEDDVTTRVGRAAERGLANRREPQLRELTSRMSNEDIPAVLAELERSYTGRSAGYGPDAGPSRSGSEGQRAESARAVDVLLATNMIAVGVDVPRLGAMIVANQPKSPAEYIQATSRVGRAAPGLVFTVYNWARPRDLSHYESFEAFHATMYQHVEALSVTPFADRAIDRGLSGVLAALVRDLRPDYNTNLGAGYLTRDSELADHVTQYLRRRALDVTGHRAIGEQIQRHLDDRLDYWERRRRAPGIRLGYRVGRGTQSGDIEALLREPETGAWTRFTCPTSLRNVEPGIQLILSHDPDSHTKVDQDTDEPAWAARASDEDQNAAGGGAADTITGAAGTGTTGTGTAGTGAAGTGTTGTVTTRTGADQ